MFVERLEIYSYDSMGVCHGQMLVGGIDCGDVQIKIYKKKFFFYHHLHLHLSYHHQ